MSGHAEILVVDDDQSIRSSLRGLLEDEGYVVSEASSGEECLQIMNGQHQQFDAILMDIWMGGMDGLEALKLLKKDHPLIPVLMISGHANIDSAVKATKYGAYHYIEKPFSVDNLLLNIENGIKAYKLERENQFLREQSPALSYEIVGSSPQFQRMMQQIDLIANNNAWVLIQGENGTGKESVAHLIHQRSDRHDKPFVEVNCAAIPEELIESELFGHEKGSFTGATKRKIGKFDQADGGVLFLDEIGDMSLKTQAKILRVLQEKRFERVGGNKVINVDVRVIAASNKMLEEEIKAGNFREDLYYRLNVLLIIVPPLRERFSDIPELANYFIKELSKTHARKPKQISAEAMQILQNYHWPGNIRELKNIIERMVIMTMGDKIDVADVNLPSINTSAQSPAENNNVSSLLNASTYREAKQLFDEYYLKHQLDKNDGNISKTANAIQIERSTLHKKIKSLDF